MLYQAYASGIDQFLECGWFETKGMTHMEANQDLLAQYSALLDSFTDTNINEPSVLAAVESREAKVVWSTMTLCRDVHARLIDGAESMTTPATDPDLLYAVKRLSVFETLVTGFFLDTNPVDMNSYPESDPAQHKPGLAGQMKERELEFWQAMGRFVTASPSSPPSPAVSGGLVDANGNTIGGANGNDSSNDGGLGGAGSVTDMVDKEVALLTARGLLDTFENRDVIYSIAIVRHIAKYQPRRIRATATATASEKDTASKLYVACRFLEDEGHGKGTNQVIKRLCGLVVNYWEELGAVE